MTEYASALLVGLSNRTVATAALRHNFEAEKRRHPEWGLPDWSDSMVEGIDGIAGTGWAWHAEGSTQEARSAPRR